MNKTRKRRRQTSTRERPVSSWSSLLFLFAAASIASSSSTTSWGVQGQTDPGSNETDELPNVRGGRGGGKETRAFVRQSIENPLDAHEAFLQWCRESLGIDTSLIQIDAFDYPDYIKAMQDRIDIFCEDCNDDDDDDELDRTGATRIRYLDEADRYLSVQEEYPPISVRGLKAARTIHVGEVVLSVPHSALWTVHNAIDASGDSNLVDSMGPDARKQHGWESPGMDEIPLLAVTLLYHLHSNPDDDDPAPYLDLLLAQNLHESIPHLWSSRTLRKAATPAVRKVAQGIRKDVVELYESIVQVLIQTHPDVFGPPQQQQQDQEWMFSLEKFHWAFAIVNSRHWHLEIPNDPFAVVQEPELDEPTVSEDDHETFTDQEGPPAATPTDEWVVIQDQKLRQEEERESKLADEPNDHDDDDEEYEYWPSGNSFLAPLADLLNFGPPCTRGTYNPKSMAFEIVATCEFRKGQEITFWYTDACEDVFVANYGFTMPMMVPKCHQDHKHRTTLSSSSSQRNEHYLWEQQQQEQQQEYLEDELFHAYEELDRLDRRLDVLMTTLKECHCGNQTELLAGAWNYPTEEETAQDNSIANIPIPKTPSPPSKPGPDAQHAIRDGRSRKSKTSKQPSGDAHRPRHRHHGSMTRFRSRSHTKRLEF